MTARDPNQWPWQLGGSGVLAVFFGWLTRKVVKFRPVSVGLSDVRSLDEIARLSVEVAKIRTQLDLAVAANADLRVKIARLAPGMKD